MPIIPQVGRKAPGVRLLIAALYTFLTLGAVTMVYPFLLMLATSITSSTDTNEFRVVPRYLYQEAPLFAKYVDDKYKGDLEAINLRYHTDFKKAEQVTPPDGLDLPESKRRVEDWRAFVRTLPMKFKETGFRGYGTHPSQLAIAYREYVRQKFQNDIRALNRAYIEENDSFQTVQPPLERHAKRNWNHDSSRKMQEFLAWKARLPEEWLLVVGAEPLFAKFLKEEVYQGDLQKAAKVWGPRRSFDEIALPPAPPSDPARRRDWETFVREQLPFRYLAPTPEAAGPYRAFLKGRYKTIAKLNAAYGAQYADFSAIPLPGELPDGGRIVIDWGDFIARAIPLRMLRVDTPENRFREYLAKKEEGKPDSFFSIQPPYHLADALYVHENASAIRRDYVTRNYRLVIDYILLHGRSLIVTVIFCLAVIGTTLIVNPLCAYALSRYSLPYAYKVLLFLLATMAFPAEVAMIPNFLLLKELGLLNTYLALVLPGMASGFSIFLLKGFFDSLPKEIYEAGTIDGASETRMFFNITLPLSKPIFAVIALQAFTAAYGAFMFAFLVCQNPKMWTLMVWLYELQINNPQYIMMAALTVAAIPTLLVFVFAQNVIMRGIILPSYK